MGIQEDLATLTRPAVEAAHRKIQGHIHETPVLTSHAIDKIASDAFRSSAGDDAATAADDTLQLFFKCENFQKVGAFKARGAFFNVLSLSDEEAARGVCTHSSGNHAQALALAAQMRGIPAYIVMPGISTPSKIAATQGYGAQVTFSGSTSSEREAVLASIQASTGATFIAPYDRVGTILGQGTTGLELERQARSMIASSLHSTAGVGAVISDATDTGDLDAVIAPLGGGGLLGGIATALSGQQWNGHRAYVYGAEPSHQGGDDARRGLAADPPARIEHVSTLTIADGLRTPVGVLNWEVIRDTNKVAGVYAVTDEQIGDALRILFERLKVWVEPSAAVGLAVILFDEEFKQECRRRMSEAGRTAWRVGIVLSGGNTTVEAVAGLYAEKGESRAERRAEAKVGINGEGRSEDVAG